MKCPRCQQDNPAHARFCLGCGSRLALACASCGAELPGNARFCLQCGQAVATFTAAERSAAPETYTPRHLAEKILTSKAALEGERKQVTVLFADLKGSMELLADRDPEEARKIIDPVLELMMEAVHRYEGTVNQVHGRRHHGALRGAARSRGSRDAGLLCRAPDAERGRPLRRGHPQASRGRRADPRRPQLRRGRGALDRQRPPHGLHGGRPDDAPGRPDGAARAPRHHPHHRDHVAGGRGIRPGEAARAHADQGPGRARARLRGRGRRQRPARGCRPRWRGGSPASSGATPRSSSSARRSSRPARPRPDRGGGGGARGRQVATLLRVHPLASDRRAGSCSSRARCRTARRRRICPWSTCSRATSRSRSRTTCARCAPR